jgi:hypothetical protein
LNYSMSMFAGGVVAGEDSEEEDEFGAELEGYDVGPTEYTVDECEGVGPEVEVGENSGSPVAERLDGGQAGRPADILAGSFMDALLPRLSQTEEKLKELSASQMKLSRAMNSQTKGIHAAPALHKTHEVMRKVPVYQKKINGLRAEMKAITSMVNRMKKESLAIQLRVQQQLLEAEKRRAEASTGGGQQQ